MEKIIRKPFMFAQDVGHFKLVVFATSQRKARQYVKNQAMSSLSHRALKFVGAGQPSNPETWVAATAQ